MKMKMFHKLKKNNRQTIIDAIDNKPQRYSTKYGEALTRGLTPPPPYTILTEKIPLSYTFLLKRGNPFKYFHRWPVFWINHLKRKPSCYFHVVPNKLNDSAISCVCSKYY